MTYDIKGIEGIGPAYGEKLSGAGIKNTDDLLERCCDPMGRRRVAEKTGLSESLLLKWANMADLMRISGIGTQYAELLEASGVDTVKELRNRTPENLTRRMEDVNNERKLTRNTPTASIVTRWIEDAKSMTPTLTH